jgi:hypothetical protein
VWIDGCAGALGGLVTLAIGPWLAGVYALPIELMRAHTAANFAYAAYSLFLASRRTRPLPALVLLVFANAAWAGLCLRWAFVHAETASVFGLAHLLAEAAFVGGLAVAEWRSRNVLRGV